MVMPTTQKCTVCKKPFTGSDAIDPIAVCDDCQKILKCEITGRECGTDIMPDGCPCLCKNCQEWLRKSQEDLPPDIQKIISKHFWDLI